MLIRDLGLIFAADGDQRLDQHRAVVVVGDPALGEAGDRAAGIAAMEAFPRIRAREQPGVGLPVRDPFGRPRERFFGRGVVGQPRHRLVGELDRFGDPPDVEVRERDQQRRVVRRLPIVRRELPGRSALEDLTTAILRLRECLTWTADLAQAAHAIEVGGAEIRRGDGRAIGPPVALLAAADLGELERVVVARVRIRRHQAGGDPLMAHAHVLERTLGRERLAPDRQVRLAVHRRFGDERQDVAAVGVAAHQAGDVRIAPRDRMVGFELQDLRIDRTRRATRDLGEHAQVRHRELRQWREQRRRELRIVVAQRQHRARLREPIGGAADVLDGEVGERGRDREPARAEPLGEALRELLRQREIRARRPLVGDPVRQPRMEQRRLRARAIDRDLEPHHLVAARDPEQPVDAVLDLRVTRVEQAPLGIGDPFVVVAERDDRVTQEVIEDRERDQPRQEHGRAALFQRHDERARKDRHAMRVRQRHDPAWQNTP